MSTTIGRLSYQCIEMRLLVISILFEIYDRELGITITPAQLIIIIGRMLGTGLENLDTPTGFRVVLPIRVSL